MKSNTKVMHANVQRRARQLARRARRDGFTAMMVRIADLGIATPAIAAVTGMSLPMAHSCLGGYAPVPQKRRPQLMALGVLTLDGAKEALRDLRTELSPESLQEFKAKVEALSASLDEYPEFVSAAKRAARKLRNGYKRRQHEN